MKFTQPDDSRQCTLYSINKQIPMKNKQLQTLKKRKQCVNVESVHIQKTYDMLMLEFGNGLRCMPQILCWGKPWSGV